MWTALLALAVTYSALNASVKNSATLYTQNKLVQTAPGARPFQVLIASYIVSSRFLNARLERVDHGQDALHDGAYFY